MKELFLQKFWKLECAPFYLAGSLFILALMFSLVFVPVKLNDEHGNHLPPSLGEKPSRLMAFPRNHKAATG